MADLSTISLAHCPPYHPVVSSIFRNSRMYSAPIPNQVDAWQLRDGHVSIALQFMTLAAQPIVESIADFNAENVEVVHGWHGTPLPHIVYLLLVGQ